MGRCYVFLIAGCIATLASAVPASAQPVADHLTCFKVKDPQAKKTYTGDLDGLVLLPGCTIKVPAAMACVPTIKSNVQPPPPGGGGTGTPNAFGCYKVKCSKTTPPQLLLNDQFGTRSVTPSAPKLLCAPAAGSTTTTSSTTTTTLDTTPPTFSGSPTVAAVFANTVSSSGQLTVGWADASDDTSPPSQISYDLCWSTSATGCNSTSFTTMQTTADGVTSAMISSLTSNSTYFVWVRAVDGSGNMETGDHVGAAATAVSYANNVNPQIFSAVNTAGGCNGGGACHSPLWSYSNTVNVPAPACGSFTGNFVTPGDTAHSKIYVKMVTAPAGCGSQMPLGGPFMSNLQQIMSNWISQGAHNN